MIKYFVLCVLLVFVSTQYVTPSNFVLLQKWRFPKDSSFIAKFVFYSELMVVGFRGNSYNLSVYLRNWIQSDTPEKKEKYFDYGFQTNLTEAKGNITSIANTLTSNVFGSGSMDKTYRVYKNRIIAGRIRPYLVEMIQDPVSHVVKSQFSYNGVHLALINAEGTIRIYVNYSLIDLSKGNVTQDSQPVNTTTANGLPYKTWYLKQINEIRSTNQVTSIMFTWDQEELYVGFDNGTVCIYSLNYLPYTFYYSSQFTDTNQKITGIQSDTQSKFIITSSSDGFVRVYKIDGFNRTILSQALYEANKSIKSLEMRKIGVQFVAVSEDGYTRLYNLNQEKQKFYLLQKWYSDDTDFSASFCPEGRMLAIGASHQIKIYQSCGFSIKHCSSCSDLNTCEVCQNNYYLSSDGYCSQCSSFQGCKTCVTENMCTSCYPGYFLNVEIGVCQSCSTTIKNCKTCSSKYDCKECFMQFKLKNGICQFPLNPDIPVLVPISSKPVIEPVIETNIRTQKWTIVLIVLIIILCILIIVVLVLMIILCKKLFDKMKRREQKQAKIQMIGDPIAPSTERIEDDPNVLTQPVQKDIQFEQKDGVIPIPLEPDEKGDDQFRDLRA